MAELATTVDDVEAAGSGPAVHEPEEPAPASRPDREYTLVGLKKIRLHPLNLRKELRDLEELADSIRQNGLLEPVLLVPDPEADEDDPYYLLIAGHRRHAACLMARHDPVEAIIRRDLASDGEQVLAMLTENGPRDDLTAIEEAHGYQLALELNGLTPAKLAKRLGKPKATVASRISLTKLPEPVQERVHHGQLNLRDAEAMVEFADAPQFIDSLLPLIGTSNFGYRIEGERQRRQRQARITALRRQLAAAGAQVIDPPRGFPWTSTEQPVSKFIDPVVEPGPDGKLTPFTPEAHAAACPLHAVFIHPHDVEPVYVCRNPAEAGHQSVHQRPATTVASPIASAEAVPDADADSGVDGAAAEAERLRQEEERQRQAEELQRQAEAEARRREALQVAAGLRRGFLTTLVGRSGKAHLQAVLRLLLTENLEAWLDDASLEDLQQLAGVIDARVPEQTDDASPDDLWEEVERNLRAALDSRRTPDALAGALLAIVVHNREAALAAGYGWSDPSCRRYLDWLVAQGYETTEPERELLGDVEVD
jgi:ParB/RepB/Spo0J family partition protein